MFGVPSGEDLHRSRLEFQLLQWENGLHLEQIKKLEAAMEEVKPSAVSQISEAPSTVYKRVRIDPDVEFRLPC